MSDPVRTDEDKKEEILERIRKSKKDEGMDYADYRGTRIGIIVYAAVAFVLVVFSVPDQMNIVYAIISLSFGWVVGGTFSYYRFTKKKIFLICAIASALVTVFNAIMALR